MLQELKQGYADGQEQVARGIQKKHMKKALRKYKSGDLYTIANTVHLPALLADDWELVDTIVKVMSPRFLLRHARPA